MPRRGNNIYKRQDGRWEGRILKETALPGEARYKYVYGRTYGEIKKKMEAVRLEMKSSRPGCHITMEEAVGLWLSDRQDCWKATTNAAYRSLTGKYIVPFMGSCEISTINDQTLRQFAERIRRRENGKLLSNGYLHGICSIVLMVLNHMRKKYRFAVEIPELPDFLSRRGSPAALPGESDLRTLENYLKGHPSKDGTSLGILVSLYTGIRIGELCALRWENIDLEDEIISIRQDVQRMKNFGEGESNTTVIFQTPKTETSVREIPIPPALLPYLKAHQEKGEAFLIHGKRKPFAEPRTVEYRFAKILDVCSLKHFRFHMLRHVFATRCISMGFDVKSLSELLGHSNVKTTLSLYVHSSMTRKKQLMKLFQFPETEEKEKGLAASF